METSIKTNQINTSINKSLCICVVDDDPFYRSMLVHNLSKNPENKVIAFNCGEELLKRYIEVKPNVIVMDYKLDELNDKCINGLETIQRVRAIDPEVYIIMLSGQDDVRVTANSIKFGAYDYIVKSQSAFLRLSEDIRKIVLDKVHRKQNIEVILLVLALILFVFISSIISNYESILSAILIPFVYLLILGSFLVYHLSKKEKKRFRKLN